MEANHKIICRLCLKISLAFETINGDMKHVLNVLMPKINLAAVDEPVMCTNCMEVIIKCFDFKATCFYTYDYIVPFFNNNENTAKVDLLDVYLSKNENGTGIPDDQDICAFCMSPVQKCFAISLDVEESDSVLENMIQQCVPELDLNSIKKPIICAPCHGSLEYCFRFVMDCLIVEEKIKKYCETQDINGANQIELSSLLQFTIGDVTARKKNKLADKEESSKLDGRDLVKNKRKTKELDFNRFEDGVVLRQPEVITNLSRRRKRLMSHREGNKLKPYLKHISKNESKQNFKNHCRLHKKPSKIPMYHCASCSYQSKFKTCLIRHLLVHKESSEVPVYKCDNCSHQTIYKEDLKKHLLVHKDPSEVTIYKCDSCSFQSKYPRSLAKHLLVHKDPSEVPMYKCDNCSHQTRNKDDLKKHLLVHKDPSEVAMYKCDSCLFQTKFKSGLNRHFLMSHKDPSEVTIYKCDSCSFRTKHKTSLAKHLLVHKDPSEVPMYKCDNCSHQTKTKADLKKHLLVHKNPSEVTIYKCDSCSFQSKYQGSLVKHLLLHKDPSEVPMYKCDNCSHQTRNKGDLKKHLLVHKDPSEVTMYKCDYCSYQTRHTAHLKKHLRVHNKRTHKKARN